MATTTRTRIKRTVSAPDSSQKPILPQGRYFAAVGRRKTSIARVKLWSGVETENAKIIVNDIDHTRYFPYFDWREIVEAPLRVVGLLGHAFVAVRVSGGGKISQAGAARHGLARALVLHDAALRIPMRAQGFLTRDPRMKERKKYGLKRARKAPQWAKR